MEGHRTPWDDSKSALLIKPIPEEQINSQYTYVHSQELIVLIVAVLLGLVVFIFLIESDVFMLIKFSRLKILCTMILKWHKQFKYDSIGNPK